MTEKIENAEPSEFEQRLEASRKVERAVSAWLQRAGWHVLAASEYSGANDDHAPVLEAANDDEELIVPDLLVCARGNSRWVEAKLKASATWTTATERLETGLSRRLWQHYERVEQESGIPVHLIFLHLKEGEVRGASLSFLRSLGPRFYEGPKLGPWGHVFFPFHGLPLLARVADVLPDEAA